MNPFRSQWIARIRTEGVLSGDAKSVAELLATAGVFGRVALTNWRRLNLDLGKPAGDVEVLDHIRELQAAGYLGRYQGNKFNQSRGWGLYLPEEASNLLEFWGQAA